MKRKEIGYVLRKAMLPTGGLASYIFLLRNIPFFNRRTMRSKYRKYIIIQYNIFQRFVFKIVT